MISFCIKFCSNEIESLKDFIITKQELDKRRSNCEVKDKIGGGIGRQKKEDYCSI